MRTSSSCRFWTRVSFAAAALAAACLPALAGGLKAAEAKTKIVFLAGGPSHSYGSHEHKAGCLLLADCLRQNVAGVETQVLDEWPKDASVLQGAAAIIVFCDGGGRHVLGDHWKQVRPAREEGRGPGLLALRRGSRQGEPGDYLLDWMGGYYEAFWSVNPIWEANFTTFPVHPMTARREAVHDE